MPTTENTETRKDTEEETKKKRMNSALERINQASTFETESMFEDCCGSATWASMMTMMRPFASEDELIQIAAAVWNDQEILQTDDWLEAFSAHPKIGETKATKAQFAEWSAVEQAGMNSADERLKQALVEANREYLEKFGFIFIVCASGKSAGEMLELCRARLGNDRETEIANAAAEQQKITEIRLRKLLSK
jgi:2-oxo-4-hydroxy-4-carboxy-5-ureidoimidazoline decarboxylase